MIGRINVGGGGGLNFKIVGGTSAPANPQENTVWVNTDKDITAWMFCSSEPTDAVEGAVWFLTGASSVVSFNALKKNMVEVYPISAKQKVNGTMVDVTAKSWQNGKWSDWWNGEYFDNGNQFEGITGGWTANGYTVGDRTMSGETIIGNTIHLKATAAKGAAVAGTSNAVDLKDVSTIYFNVTEVSHTNNCKVGVASTKAIGATAEVEVTKTGVVSLDVSALNDKYYIYANLSNSTSQTTRTMTIDKVWGSL